jgi:hypothetical protein
VNYPDSGSGGTIGQLGKQIVPATNRQVLVPLPDWQGDRYYWLGRLIASTEIDVLGAGSLYRLLSMAGGGEILRHSRRQWLHCGREIMVGLG